MSSVLAVVAKAVFEKQGPKHAQVGQLWPTDAYLSHHAKLEPLAGGGTLFLATVRPPDERLWLVALLASPKHEADGWRAAANVVPIADITHLLPELRFDSGKGNTAEPGKLGMSLQTPRGLTEADVALLMGVVLPEAQSAVAKPATKPKAGKVVASKPAAKKPAAAEASAVGAKPAHREAGPFDAVAARRVYAARVEADLAGLDAKSRAGIEELCATAPKSPKKSFSAMKKLAASFGKKSAAARVAYDAFAHSCLEKSAEHAGEAFGEARALGFDAKRPPTVAEEIATLRLFSRKQAIWGATIAAFLGAGRLAKASEDERLAFADLVVELAGLGFEPREALTRALLQYDPALAKAALVAWTRDPAKSVWRDLDPAEWATFGPVVGEAAAEEPSFRRWLASWTPRLRERGWGAAWLEVLAKNRVTAILAQQEPALLGPHLATLATIGSYHGLMDRTVARALDDAFAAAGPTMKANGVEVDLTRRTREKDGWRPQYLDLPTAFVLELMLARGVPLRLPTPVRDVTLPLVGLGLLPSAQAAQLGELSDRCLLRRVLAEPVLREGILRVYLPGAEDWSDVHEHVRELEIEAELGPLFDGLAAFVTDIAEHGGLAAFLERRTWLEAYAQPGLVGRSPALAKALSSLDAGALLQRQLRGGIMAEWGWPRFDALGDELGDEAARRAVSNRDSFRTKPQLLVDHHTEKARRFVSIGPLGTAFDHTVTGEALANVGSVPLGTGDDVLTWEWGQRAHWLLHRGPPIPMIEAGKLVDGHLLIRRGARRGQLLAPGTAYEADHEGWVAEVFDGGAGCFLVPSDAFVRADGSIADPKADGPEAMRAFDPRTGAIGEVALPAFFREAFAKVPANAELSVEGSLLYVVPGERGGESALGAHAGIAGWACFRVPRATGDGHDFALVRPDGAVATAPLEPRFLLGFPGREARLLDGHDAEGRPHFIATGDLHALFWGGSPVVLPRVYWPLFEPRDVAGSKALEGCSIEAARALLVAARTSLGQAGEQSDLSKLDYGDLAATITGPKKSLDATKHAALFAAVRAALPAVTHPRLLLGVAEMALLAATQDTALADLRGKLGTFANVAGLADAPATASEGAARAPSKRRPPLANADLEALAQVFEQDIKPWWVQKRGLELGAQIDDVDAFLFADATGGTPPPSAPARTAFAWHHLAARMGETLFALLATGTPAEKREQLVRALERWADTEMAAHAEQLRIVSLSFEALPHPTIDDEHPDWLIAWENRYFLRLTGVRDGRPSFLALERSVDGVFRAPPGASVGWEARDPRAGKATVLAALALLRERGPAPWDPAIAEALASGTGMGAPTAALLWGGSTKPFEPGKQGKTALGLRSADLEIAELELSGLSNRFLYQEGMPLHPAALYAPLLATKDGPSVIETWVTLWNGRDRKRAPLPLSLVKQLRADLGAGIGRVHVHARDLVAPEASPYFTEDRAWHMPPFDAFTDYGSLPEGWPVPLPRPDRGDADDGSEPACFAGHVLDPYAVYFAWAALELPFGHPTRESIGRLGTLVRARLQNPELLFLFGWAHLRATSLEEAFAKGFAKLRGPAYEGASGQAHAPGFDHGDLVVTWPDPREANGFFVAVRPAAIGDDAAFAKLAARLSLPVEATADIVGRRFDAKGKDLTTADRFHTYAAVRSAGFQRLLAELARAPEGATKGCFAADPRVSASATVKAAMKAHGLDQDAATLYLQIAALPDATEARVLRYNGWKAPTHSAAAKLLLAKKLVVEAKQARTTRTLFLPGPVMTLGVSGRAIEVSKAPLYGLLADATKKQQSVFPVLLPLSPLGELFAAAWALVRG